jgi:hypothetical protein
MSRERPIIQQHGKKCSDSIDELAGFLPQPAQNPRLGDDDGVDCHVQLLRHLPRRRSIQRNAAKSLPGGCGKLRLNQLQKAVEDVAVVLLIPEAAQTAVGIDELVQDERGLGRGLLPPEFTEEVDRDAAQPGPKGARPAVCSKCGSRRTSTSSVRCVKSSRSAA